ncbi:uncharacterized protein A4U43_C07F18740 [Asparagus officinalis]|uniref:C2 domain-containing protein n=1 Tax=Asparagus officinalis TaxID=4686 RepID=A0A5P1EG15_ASPOF|nr:uncharacterized protein A4U43_C07F18740 [Asparagus officinalis]
MASRYEVEVTITSARDLKNVNWRYGDLKPYAVVWADKAAKCSTKVDVEGDVNPVWDEKLRIPLPGDRRIEDSTLYIDIVRPIPTTRRTPSPSSDPPASPSERSSMRPGSGRPHGKLDVKVAVKEPTRYYDPYAPPYGQVDQPDARTTLGTTALTGQSTAGSRDYLHRATALRTVDRRHARDYRCTRRPPPYGQRRSMGTDSHTRLALAGLLLLGPWTLNCCVGLWLASGFNLASCCLALGQHGFNLLSALVSPLGCVGLLFPCWFWPWFQLLVVLVRRFHVGCLVCCFHVDDSCPGVCFPWLQPLVAWPLDPKLLCWPFVGLGCNGFSSCLSFGWSAMVGLRIQLMLGLYFNFVQALVSLLDATEKEKRDILANIIIALHMPAVAVFWHEPGCELKSVQSSQLLPQLLLHHPSTSKGSLLDYGPLLRECEQMLSFLQWFRVNDCAEFVANDGQIVDVM